MEVIHNPQIPFWSVIPGGVDAGTVIKIDGHVPHHFDRFSIDLMCGHEMSHHAEHHNSIALHFNPRHFESCVVLNSRHYQEWGHEDRKQNEWHAFHRGNMFSITIHVEPEYYRIDVNGNHFANFYHRVPLYEVKSLKIDGDVRVNFIEYRRESQIAVAVATASTVPYPTMPYPSAPPPPAYVPQTVSYPAVPAAPVYMPTAPYVPTSPYVPTAQPYVPVVAPTPTVIIEEGYPHHHHHRPGFISSVIDEVYHPHHNHHHNHHW